MGRELIEKVFEKFENHLNIENNNRIVFSGKFGIGKSYFLNEFFKDEKYEKEYFPIFLNPVNYSIASNEDIFELIKFDILFQILNKDVIVFEKLNFPKGNLIHQYFTNKFLEDFVSTSDLIGENFVEENASGSYGILKSLGKLIAKLSELSKRDFEKFEDEIKRNPELEIINSFFTQQESKIGSFYESNAITQLIYELIKNIEEETHKKMTLVIDDLDRIDPEHIFRILNIFSAHDKLGENKFGFEKVILVCDINNIKHIYHHFYGENVDFFGYINKFYTSEIYKYSNKHYVGYFVKSFNDSHPQTENINFLGRILSDGISKNIISARQLFQNDFSVEGVSDFYNNLKEQNFTIYYRNRHISNFSSYQKAFATIASLAHFYGDRKNLNNYFEIVEYAMVYKFTNVIGELYYFLNFTEIKNQTVVTPYGFTLKSDYDRYELLDFSKINLEKLFKDVLIQYYQILQENSI